MSRRVHRRAVRQPRNTAALLVCTAVSDIAIAIVAVINPDVAPAAIGTIATLTTAGVAATLPLVRPTAS